MDFNTALTEIAAAAVRAGNTATAGTVKNENGNDRLQLLINGHDMTYSVSVGTQRAKDSVWGCSARKPKYYVSVGQYGGRVTVLQKKDGTFNWDRAVECLVEEARTRVRRSEAENTTETNRPIIAALKEEVPGLKSYGLMSVYPSKSPALPAHVTLKIDGNYSVEQAKAIYAALVGLGLARA